MNAALLPILFMVSTDAVASSAPRHHIDGIGAMKLGSGKLIPTIFIAQS